MKQLIHYLILAILIAKGMPLLAQTKRISMQDALQLASENNKVLQVQILAQKRTKEAVRESAANKLPSFKWESSYNYFFDKAAIFLPGAFAGTPSTPVADLKVGGKNAFNTYLSLAQPLWSKSIQEATTSAKLENGIQEILTEETSEKLALDVSILYLNILLVDEQLKLKAQSLLRNQKALGDSRSLFFQGRSLKVDTLRISITSENLRSSISLLKNNREVMDMRLKRLLGISSKEQVQLTDTLEFNAFDSNQIIESNSTEQRSDLKLQSLQVDLSKQKLAEVKAEQLPTLYLLGQYQIQAQANDLRFSKYSWPNTSFLGVHLAIPVFAGNKMNYRKNQAAIKVRQNELMMEDLRENAETEISALVSNYREALRQLDIQKKTVQSAHLNYKMINERFQNGLSSRIELTDAEFSLTESEFNYLNSIYITRVLELNLEHARGELRLH